MSTLYSVGQANQLADALEAAGFTPDQVTQLRSQPDLLRAVWGVLEGFCTITNAPYINCSVDPYVPPGWRINKHVKGDLLRWGRDEILFIPAKDRQPGTPMRIHELCQEFEDRPVVNANALDFLRVNPCLIPDECGKERIFFLGTTFFNSLGRLCVRYLQRTGDDSCHSDVLLLDEAILEVPLVAVYHTATARAPQHQSQLSVGQTSN